MRKKTRFKIYKYKLKIRKDQIKHLRILMSSNKYSGRIDPIQTLRTSIMSCKKIRQKEKYLYFDKDIKLPLKTPTAWLSPITNKQYTIGAIWAYLEFKDNSSDYPAKTTDYDVQMINIADREQIQKYFTGKISQTNCINQELKIQLLTKSAKRDEPVGGLQPENQLRKKQLHLPYDLKVIDYVLRIQRPTGSKTRSLRSAQSFHFFLDLLREKSQSTTQKEGQIKSRLNRIYQKKKLPIIIVPEAIQAGNISLSNLEKLLKQGQYEEPKPLTNTLQRKIEMEAVVRGKKIIFEVTNNPSLLSLSDWENVVAVFILGQKSEFQSWAIRDPLEIFKKTKGFLLKYSNISKYQANDWNIKTLIVERNARYRDQEIQKKIWTQIQEFLFQKL